MTESQSPITRLSADDQCKLAEINAAMNRAGVRQTPQQTLLQLLQQTEEVSFSAAVQEGHRQMLAARHITNSQCRVVSNLPAQ